MNIVGSGTKVTLRTTDGEKSTMYIENPVVSLRSIQRFGVSALDGKWKKISDRITLLAQDFVNVIGTADTTPDTSSDAYVEIISPVATSATINIDRSGMSYANDETDISEGVAIASVTYTDDYDNSRI